jgi:hypothetical protein
MRKRVPDAGYAGSTPRDRLTSGPVMPCPPPVGLRPTVPLHKGDQNPRDVQGVPYGFAVQAHLVRGLAWDAIADWRVLVPLWRGTRGGGAPTEGRTRHKQVLDQRVAHAEPARCSSSPGGEQGITSTLADGAGN